MKKVLAVLVILLTMFFVGSVKAGTPQKLVLFNEVNIGPFALNSAWLDKEMKRQLLAIKLPQPTQIEVIGFTDASGPMKWNKILALARARAVYQELKKIYPNLVGKVFAKPFDGQSNLVNYRFCRLKIFISPQTAVNNGLVPQLLNNYKQLRLGQAEIKKNLGLILAQIKKISAPSAEIKAQAASLSKVINAIQVQGVDFSQALAELKAGQQKIVQSVSANGQRINRLEQKVENGFGWLQVLHFIGWLVVLFGLAAVMAGLVKLARLFPRTEKVYFYVGERNFFAKVRRDNLGWHNPVRTKIIHKKLKDLKRSLASDMKVFLRFEEAGEKPSQRWLANGLEQRITRLIEQGEIQEVGDENNK